MSLLRRLTTLRSLAVLLVLVLLGGFLLSRETGGGTRTVTAHFPSAVSVYVGTDVRVLGVTIGRVTAVVPEGESVRVEMVYDDEHRLPAEAQAAVVTPTLVADRFVQLGPAWTEGPTLADGADIALADTGVPVELDRIYKALRDLTSALGPNGVNADGTLDRTLQAASTALRGNGARGNQMLQDLSEAAVTFGQGSGDLFATVEQLAVFSDNLARNDAVVRAFVEDLAGVSRDLVEEREELAAALDSVAGAVGTVRTFVRGNRRALVTDVEKLSRVMKTINSERESLDDALTVAPVALGNLAIAFNAESGSIGSRIGFDGNIADFDGLLCAIVQQSDIPAATKQLSCRLLERLLEPVLARQASAREGAGGLPAATRSGAGAPSVSGIAPRTAPGASRTTPPPVRGPVRIGTDTSVEALLGGAS